MALDASAEILERLSSAPLRRSVPEPPDLALGMLRAALERPERASRARSP